MTSFKARAAKHLFKIKAARQIKKEIEKAGLDNLIILAENGSSIVGTFLNGCSPKEKETYRRDLKTLQQLGVTVDMLLDEVARQIPEIAPIMRGMSSYRNAEIANVTAFIKE